MFEPSRGIHGSSCSHANGSTQAFRYRKGKPAEFTATICCAFTRSCCKTNRKGKVIEQWREPAKYEVPMPNPGVDQFYQLTGVDTHCENWLRSNRDTVGAPKKGCSPWFSAKGEATVGPCRYSGCSVTLKNVAGKWFYHPVSTTRHGPTEGSRQMAVFYNIVIGYTPYDQALCMSSCQAVVGQCVPQVLSPLPGASPGWHCGSICLASGVGGAIVGLQ